VLSGTNTLCGSCTPIFHTFRMLVQNFSISIVQASRLCSTNPANVAKIPKVGLIKEGYKGDFLLLNESLILEKTIVAGQVVYSKSLY